MTGKDPARYSGDGEVSCSRAMKSMMHGTSLGPIAQWWWGCAFKYLWRWVHKNGEEDLMKAADCVERLRADVYGKEEEMENEVTEDGEVGPMTMLELLVSETEHATESGDEVFTCKTKDIRKVADGIMEEFDELKGRLEDAQASADGWAARVSELMDEEPKGEVYESFHVVPVEIERRSERNFFNVTFNNGSALFRNLEVCGTERLPDMSAQYRVTIEKVG